MLTGPLLSPGPGVTGVASGVAGTEPGVLTLTAERLRLGADVEAGVEGAGDGEGLIKM